MSPDLLQMAMPWWELVLRAVVVYVALLVMVRFAGKRAVGQFTPFDMILLILLGTAVQNSLLGDDVSLPGGLVLAATLIAMNWLVGLLTARSDTLDDLVEGAPVLLARDGKVFRDILKREKINAADFAQAMRRENCDDATEISYATLETDGRISIVTKSRQ